MKCFVHIFILFLGFNCHEIKTIAVFLNETNDSDIDFSVSAALKIGQEIIKLRLEVMDLNMDKQNESLSEIRQIIDENFTKIFDMLKQIQGQDKQQLEKVKIKNLADSGNEATHMPFSTTELTSQNEAETIFRYDIQEKDEPKMCKLNSKGNLICSDLLLPTMCSDSNSLNCVNSQCRVKNSIYGSKSFWISCDGEWTVIQRRINGSVNFYRKWNDYKNGFGDLDGEFWLGLDKLHSLTTIHGPVELYVEMKDFHDVWKFATYDSFSIDNEANKYFMNDPGIYFGNAGDSLRYSQREKFSTYDSDNDSNNSINCASLREGAWWYFRCNTSDPYSNLNGRYYETGLPPDDKTYTGICWKTFHGGNNSMKFVQMKIRAKK
uniref:Fibrinogen C-terminal domain-containing protein n=1 Tax=Stomoxys calcitrans TaxID=35570 RepID=A0A1I8Q2Z1_STOCA